MSAAGAMYTIGSIPAGRYASQLEWSWARWFRRHGWPVRYVGDQLQHADFVMEVPDAPPLFIETKPPGDDYLRQAFSRARVAGLKELLVISDSPGFSQWFYCTAVDAMTFQSQPVDSWPREDWPAVLRRLRGAI